MGTDLVPAARRKWLPFHPSSLVIGAACVWTCWQLNNTLIGKEIESGGAGSFDWHIYQHGWPAAAYASRWEFFGGDGDEVSRTWITGGVLVNSATALLITLCVCFVYERMVRFIQRSGPIMRFRLSTLMTIVIGAGGLMWLNKHGPNPSAYTAGTLGWPDAAYIGFNYAGSLRWYPIYGGLAFDICVTIALLLFLYVTCECLGRRIGKPTRFPGSTL